MQRYSDCSGVTMKGITRRCTMLKISNRSENKYFHTSSHRLTHTTTRYFKCDNRKWCLICVLVIILVIWYLQRRAVVDTLGWEPFQNWFYDQAFRGWWQVGFLLVGSPQFHSFIFFKGNWMCGRPSLSDLPKKDCLEDGETRGVSISMISVLNFPYLSILCFSWASEILIS